jgi:hypothetical protein
MAKKKAKVTPPPWCLGEADYHRRERLRRHLVRELKRQAIRFTTTGLICLGCDQAIWEALLPGDVLWRGCHCLSLCLSEAMKAQPFDAQRWEALTTSGGLLLAIEQRRWAELN